MKDLLLKVLRFCAKRIVPGQPLAIHLPHRLFSSSFMIPKRQSNHCGFDKQGLPVPPSDFWLGYGPTKEEYLADGEHHVENMLDELNKCGFQFQQGDRLLDFGCGAGRMIRWLKSFADQCEIWGVDIRADHIFWCKQHLSPDFNFSTITTVPHLPFEDRYFRFIYAGSVFTHIDDLADAWFLELRRVLDSDGMLYATIHDENTIAILEAASGKSEFGKDLMRDPNYERYIHSDFGMFTIGRSIFSQVFYASDYFCDMLQGSFKVVSVRKETYGYQTGVLLAKK